MELKFALEAKKFDLRIRDRVMGEGKLSKSDVDEFINALPDDVDNVIEISDKAAPKNEAPQQEEQPQQQFQEERQEDPTGPQNF